ncbi:MAG: biopolymer transporter ExbD [Flavobacteriales bacterium]|nr:biopolymer transporter ExbD [Flavobacteriales bacterium]
MSKFKKDGTRELPPVSTASLPDIVFMLLFFFMVTTVMREVDILVKQSSPAATEIQKLENRALVHYIYIGEPQDTEKFGTEPRIQLADDYGTVGDVGAYIIKMREEVVEGLIPKLTTSLKVDRDVKMGVITDVKQELRRVSALKLNYAAVEGGLDK